MMLQEELANLIVVYLNPEEEQERYKDANIISFAPSEKWGFLDGTLNFNQNDIRERIEMGYQETKKTISSGVVLNVENT